MARRGKRSLAVSLKAPEGIALLRKLLSPADGSNAWRADILIDPFRPGVLERLGLDPKELLERNPRLIIARLTGFRREGENDTRPNASCSYAFTTNIRYCIVGPYSHMAGHDINYLALSGVLAMLGRKGDKPYAPANTLGEAVETTTRVVFDRGLTPCSLSGLCWWRSDGSRRYFGGCY